MKLFALVLTWLLINCTVTLARNPGLKLRLSKKGLNYAAGVTVDQLSSKVKGQHIPDQHGSSRVAVGKVDYDITGMRITSFTRPGQAVTTNAGTGITLSLTNAGVSVHGDWRYKYRLGFIKIRDHGNFDVSVSGVSIRLAIAMGMDSAGRPTISTRSCDCHVGDVKVKFHGGASWLYNLFDKSVEKPIERGIRSQLCNQLQKLVNVDAAESLRKLKVRVPIEGFITLDYSLVAAPVFGFNYLESLHKAEFFWTQNQTEAPFQPQPIDDLPGAQKMVTFYLSDYVSNSLGYAIFTYGSQFLRYSLTQKDLSPENRHFLNTTIFPPIAEKYPHSTIELLMYATRQPTLETNNSKIIGRFRGNIEFQIREVNGELIDWFTLDVRAVIVIGVNMTNQVIRATVKTFGSHTNITKTEIEPVPPSVVINLLFRVVTRNFIVPKLNEVGKKGFPLPALDHVEYVNPELHLLNGTLCFTSDLKYVPK